MKLLKPSWVHHDEKPIFSVDVHQDCCKFATGGQGNDSGRVVIWNLMPVLSEKAELDASVPKMLCRMDNHLACVNCVRWSQSGLMLASGSDDKLVMIWRQSKGTSNIFDSGGIRKDHESWKCAHTLRGHSGDVLDMAWSPQDRWLASCSIDNNVIVWDVQNFPAMIAMLKGHTGLVKGVAWDPVGKFLASQSDDRSVKIWKTSDWTCSNTITEPFEGCGGTTHILRLSWSPDGQYLVSAHAMNGGGPTAQIIDREGWKCDKDFVGHRKAVTCVRFHTSILRRLTPKSQKPQQYCCLAVGSRDRSLSVWMTALQRPLLVIHDLFNDSILDLSWGPRRCILMACSGDGTVACLQFSENELGTPLSEDDRNSLYQRIYGKNAGVLANGSNVVDDMIIEHPELLDYVQEKVKPPILPTDTQMFCYNNNKEARTLPTFHPPTNGFLNHCNPTTPSITSSMDNNLRHNVANGSTTSTQHFDSNTNSNLTNVLTMTNYGNQVETRAADGKRRITPVFIPTNTNFIQPTSTPTNSATINSNPVNAINILNNIITTTESSSYSPNSTDRQSRRTTVNVEECSTSSLSINSMVTDTASITVSSSSSSVVTTTRTMSASGPLFSETVSKTSQLSIGGTIQTHNSSEATACQEQSRLDYRLTQNLISGVSATKQKTQPGTLNAKDLPKFPSLQSTPMPAVNSILATGETLPHSGPKMFQASTIGPKIHITDTTKCEFQKTALGYRVHVHNGFQKTASGYLAKVTAFKLGTGTLWETFVGSPLINLNFCSYCGMLCSLDGTVRLLELETGRPLIPAISLTSVATQCAFSPNGSLVGVVTENGTLRIWKIKSRMAVLANSCSDIVAKNGSVIQFYITEQAVPLILCANGNAYSYSSQMQSWLVVNSIDPITHCGLQAFIPKTFSGNFASFPVTSVQTIANTFTSRKTDIELNENNWQGLAKIIFIENQIKLCETLNLPDEFKHWFNLLIYHFAIGGNEHGIRLILNELLSDSTRRDGNNGQKQLPPTHILNIPKEELFELALNELKLHIKWQRIYIEYKELYGSIRSIAQQ